MTRDQVRDSLARRGRAQRAPLPPPPAPVEPSRWIGREVALRLAAEAYGVTSGDLISHRRPRDYAAPRALFVWACRRFGRRPSYAQLGGFLGGRDHSTMNYLDAKAVRLLAEDDEFFAAAERIAIIAKTEGNLSHASH